MFLGLPVARKRLSVPIVFSVASCSSLPKTSPYFVCLAPLRILLLVRFWTTLDIQAWIPARVEIASSVNVGHANSVGSWKYIGYREKAGTKPNDKVNLFIRAWLCLYGLGVVLQKIYVGVTESESIETPTVCIHRFQWKAHLHQDMSSWSWCWILCSSHSLNFWICSALEVLFYGAKAPCNHHNVRGNSCNHYLRWHWCGEDGMPNSDLVWVGKEHSSVIYCNSVVETTSSGLPVKSRALWHDKCCGLLTPRWTQWSTFLST